MQWFSNLNLGVLVVAAINAVPPRCAWAINSSQDSKLPWSVSSVRDALRAGAQLNPLVQCLLLVLALVLVLLLVYSWYRRRSVAVQRWSSSPNVLFRRLLEKLDMDKNDRKLLCKMAKGARLRHPAEMLLSPELLDWSRRLWLTAKGANVVTPQVSEQLDSIAVKLFGHRANSSEPAEPISAPTQVELLPVNGATLVNGVTPANRATSANASTGKTSAGEGPAEPVLHLEATVPATPVVLL